jgi:Maltokinase N-terminal cap domain
MAILYQATLTPTKLALVDTWLPAQPWTGGVAGPSELVGNFRFDDPDGEVGIETLLLRLADAPTVQVPLTYRSAPLEGSGAALIGTIAHSVLGERWVYDGCFDPVYATALATAIMTGGAEAKLEVITDDGIVLREPTVRVNGNGSDPTATAAIHELTATSDETSTTIHSVDLELVVRRLPGGARATDDALMLSGVWSAVDTPVVLALARAR